MPIICDMKSISRNHVHQICMLCFTWAAHITYIYHLVWFRILYHYTGITIFRSLSSQYSRKRKHTKCHLLEYSDTMQERGLKQSVKTRSLRNWSLSLSTTQTSHQQANYRYFTLSIFLKQHIYIYNLCYSSFDYYYYII